MSLLWKPTREFAQTRLELFIPEVVDTYAEKGNFNLSPLSCNNSDLTNTVRTGKNISQTVHMCGV